MDKKNPKYCLKQNLIGIKNRNCYLKNNAMKLNIPLCFESAKEHTNTCIMV